MLVDHFLERGAFLKDSLEAAGYDVISQLSDTENLDDYVRKLMPDLVVIDTESPSRDTLEHLCVMTESTPKPVVMFTHDGDMQKMREATRAGVSAYVVGRIPNDRLRPVINAAVARFEEFNALRDELSTANLKLAERKIIEKAKGLLVKQKNIDEEQAYTMLRNMAMSQNIKIADLAKQVIQAATLLL